ncbi:pilus assembly protein TadG-related protein [Vibrio olivae]
MESNHVCHVTKGAVTLWLSAALFSLVIFCSLALDMARLAYERHALQSIADLAALQVSRSTPYFIDKSQRSNLETSLFSQYESNIDELTLRLGSAKIVDNQWIVDMSSAPEHGYQAAQVIVSHSVPRSTIAGGLFNGDTLNLTATAAVQKSSWVLFGLGSKTLSTSDTGLLNSLLGGLLGIELDLGIADYDSLVHSAIDLRALLSGLAIEENLGSPQEVLAADISLMSVMEAYLTVLSQEDEFPQALNLIVNELTMLEGPIPKVSLGDLIHISSSNNAPDAALSSSINAFSLITSTIYAANSEHFVDISGLNVSLPGIASVNLQASIIEPAQFAIATLPILDNQTISGKRTSRPKSCSRLRITRFSERLNRIGRVIT